jgi:hypothetical protein
MIFRTLPNSKSGSSDLIKFYESKVDTNAEEHRQSSLKLETWWL